MNLQKFYMGESFDAYEYFGAHLEDGGVVFRTYAPNAWGINVVGEFNGWKEEPLSVLLFLTVTCFFRTPSTVLKNI